MLNWNNYEDSKKCLVSLEHVSYPKLKVIVVDNASADGSGFQLQTEFPSLQFIFNDKNLGFARGCNVGIRAALNNLDCSYVLLLNNDATVTRHFLEPAIEMAETNPKVGLVGGKILFSEETKKIWYAGGTIDRWKGRVWVRGFREIDHGQYDKPSEVGFVTGALMLIKREVLQKVGLLPEEYFFGGEEIDYSLAVRLAGYNLYYVPTFLVYHASDGSHSNHDPKFVYNNYRTKLILQQKYLPKGSFFIWKLVFRFYGKYFAAKVWQSLRNSDVNLKDKRLPIEDLNFAFRKALEDHGKSHLSEETLMTFASTLPSRNVPSSMAQDV